jgi:hypothetical protein
MTFPLPKNASAMFGRGLTPIIFYRQSHSPVIGWAKDEAAALKRLRKHFGDQITGIELVPHDFQAPDTPSGYETVSVFAPLTDRKES